MISLIIGEAQYRPRLAELAAVGFDVKQTLVPDVPRRQMFEAWSRLHEVPADRLRAATEELEQDSGTGYVDPVEAFQEVLKRAGRVVPDDELHYIYSEFVELRIDHGTFYSGVPASLERLRWRGLRLAALTIVSFLSYEAVRRVVSPWMHAMVYSLREGLAAKDERAFRLLSARLGVPREATLYVDDRLDWVLSAQRTGMMPVLVLHPEAYERQNIPNRADLADQGIITLDRVTEIEALIY